MRLTRTGWAVVAALLIVGGLIFSAFWWRDARELKLPDGSVLRLEKVYFGKPEPFKFGGVLERLKEKLPQSLVNRFSKPATPKPGTSWGSTSGGGMFAGGRTSWRTIGTVHTNEDALYVYITRSDPLTGGAGNVGMRWVHLVDEHGCVFPATEAGGEDDGRLAALSSSPRRPGMVSSVNWFRFEAFPRHEHKLRLQFFEDWQPQKPGEPPAKPYEFTVTNPFQKSASQNQKNWPVDTLPITNINGGVAFILMDVKLQTNSGHGKYWSPLDEPNKMTPIFKFMEDGEISSNWQAFGMELYDSSGNFAASDWRQSPPILCPHEDAWKLRVKFFGGEKSHCASNSTWTLRGLQIPSAGNYTNLGPSQWYNLDGVRIEAMFFAGTGDFKYSNNGEVIVKADASKEPLKENSMEWGNGRSAYRTLLGKTPHLTMKVWPVSDDQRLTVRATDDQGRDFYGYEWMYWQNTNYTQHLPGEVHYLDRIYGTVGNATSVAFDLPGDSKTVDVTFCIHTCLIAEFHFKPPRFEVSAQDKTASIQNSK